MRKTIAKKESRKQPESRPTSAQRDVKYYLGLAYQIELVPLSNNDGSGYFATIPLLPGCQSDGRTPDEAVKNLRHAQRAWLRSALKHGDQIPEPQ